MFMLKMQSSLLLSDCVTCLYYQRRSCRRWWLQRQQRSLWGARTHSIASNDMRELDGKIWLPLNQNGQERESASPPFAAARRRRRRSERPVGMVHLVCAFIHDAAHADEDPVVLCVEVPLEATGNQLATLLRTFWSDVMPNPSTLIALFGAQMKDKSWPTAKDIRGLRSDYVRRQCEEFTADQRLSVVFGAAVPPDRVHVFAVASQGPRFSLPPRVLRGVGTASTCGLLPSSLGDENVDSWSNDDCGERKGLRHVMEIFPSLPLKFYVRPEALMVWRVFKDFVTKRTEQARLTGTKEQGGDPRPKKVKRLVFVGTPGVGKSALLMLMSLWLAVSHKKDVVLIQKTDSGIVTTLLQGTQGRFYLWKEDFFNESSTLHPLKHFKMIATRLNAAAPVCGKPWVCLDGLCQEDLDGKLLGLQFDLLATSGSYVTPAGGFDVCLKCLVPFWTEGDLKSIAQLQGLSGADDRYDVSGGSLRHFLGNKNRVTDEVCDAVATIRDKSQAIQLYTSDGLLSAWQIDRIRMKTVDDITCYTSYVSPSCWHGVITSRLALRLLAAIMPPEDFIVLIEYARANDIGGLYGHAFEGYVHTLAHKQKRILLRTVWYNNVNLLGTRNPVITRRYIEKELQFNTSRVQGDDDEASFAVLREWAQNPAMMDYWRPRNGAFQAIDAIAKVSVAGETEFWLLQTTVSSSHTFGGPTVRKINRIFSTYPVAYVVVLPDEETQAAFRFRPVQLQHRFVTSSDDTRYKLSHVRLLTASLRCLGN